MLSPSYLVTDICTRRGWCPRTGKGQRLMEEVSEYIWLATCQSKIYENKPPSARHKTIKGMYSLDFTSQSQLSCTTLTANHRKSHSFNPIFLIFHIILNPNQASLNKRLEVFSSCRHIKKFLLSKAQRWEFKNSALVLKSDMRYEMLAKCKYQKYLIETSVADECKSMKLPVLLNKFLYF